ncbi:hypothetical protein N5P37_004829 [Trichoderma harzianum]|nr:hypothetical protein N5P37_004829 [Trichoderma harzianum]
MKCHWETSVNKSIRRIIRPIHSVNGKAMIVLSWTQFVFSGAHLSQFTTHLIMGNAYVACAITLMAVSVVSQFWLRRSRRSPEFFESCVITTTGYVQRFTQHRWGMLSRDRGGLPKRNFIPAIVNFVAASAIIHSTFGYTLMAAGLTRMVEVTFTLKDQRPYQRNITHSIRVSELRSFYGPEANTNLASFSWPPGFCSWAPPKSRWSSLTNRRWMPPPNILPFLSSSSVTCLSICTIVWQPQDSTTDVSASAAPRKKAAFRRRGV